MGSAARDSARLFLPALRKTGAREAANDSPRLSSRMERCAARFRVTEGHKEHHTTTVKVVRGVTWRVSDAGVRCEGLSEVRRTMPERKQASADRKPPHSDVGSGGQPQPGVPDLQQRGEHERNAHARL